MSSIVGYVGPASSRLRLVKLKESVEDTKELYTGAYTTSKFSSLELLIRQFLADATTKSMHNPPRKLTPQPTDLCLTMAEPPTDQSVADGLRKTFNLKTAVLLHEIQGLALNPLRREELVMLNPAASFEVGGHQMVVSVQETLKTCLLLKYSDGFREGLIVEGGRIAVPAKSPRDLLFQDFCRKKLNYEPNRSLEGGSIATPAGFVLVYEFICRERGVALSTTTPTEILQRYPDPVTKDAIAYYIELFTSAVFNVVVATLPEGGIFVVSDFFLQVIRTVGRDREQFFSGFMEQLILYDYLVEKFARTPVGVIGLSEDRCIQGCAEYLIQLYNVLRIPD